MTAKRHNPGKPGQLIIPSGSPAHIIHSLQLRNDPLPHAGTLHKLKRNKEHRLCKCKFIHLILQLKTIHIHVYKEGG